MSTIRQAFSVIPMPPGRSTTKPRNQGLTMMMDWGIPLGKQADLLGLVAPFVDLAKLVVGTARLYDESYLQQKLELYQEHRIAPFIGGQFLEYVIHQQGLAGVQPYCEEARRLGIGAIEVSDNVVEIKPEDRQAIVDIAVRCGLQVHGEVGSKTEVTTSSELLELSREWFDLGVEVVLVEAAELVDNGAPNQTLIEAFADGIDTSMVLFELPGPWIKGTASSDVLHLKKLLINIFGPDVNIANVMPDEVFETEAMRNQLSFVGPAGD